MSNEHGNKQTQNILIEAMANQGLIIKKRDREQYMNASLEVRAKHLAKVELAARKAQENFEVDEEAAMRKSGKLD